MRIWTLITVIAIVSWDQKFPTNLIKIQLLNFSILEYLLLSFSSGSQIFDFLKEGNRGRIFSATKMSEEGKGSHHHHHHHHLHHNHEEEQHPPPPPPQYGTFQGVANYPQPVIGFPQPVPPPGASDTPSQYYAHGYQAVPGSTLFNPLTSFIVFLEIKFIKKKKCWWL